MTRLRNARNAEKRRQREAERTERRANATPWEIPENPTLEDYFLPRQRIKVEGTLPPPDTRDLTGILMGDPPFERSALYQIRRKQNA